MPHYDLISPCYLQLSLAGRVRDVVQILTCRDEIIEIIVLTKAIIIVKASCSRSRIVQFFCFGLDHQVKNGKRGTCKHKTAVVRRTTT